MKDTQAESARLEKDVLRMQKSKTYRISILIPDKADSKQNSQKR
jgi:hypothetical protein